MENITNIVIEKKNIWRRKIRSLVMGVELTTVWFVGQRDNHSVITVLLGFQIKYNMESFLFLLSSVLDSRRFNSKDELTKEQDGIQCEFC